ncbi:phospholipase D-like domain-containing protein [Halomicrococcus sp. NG-SE-24]|uniref:phospholipase D-like domain-containing protein n=1 Tax=Halomicrococcus sp. NG-SE-24 TaxID=3436928 RepID=UPI003D95939D
MTDARRARAFVLPDAPGIPVETIRGADERILLAGYSFTSHRVAHALVAARERGVEVRVLLGSAWYVEEENSRLVEWLNERANEEGLPLTARLTDPRGYRKVHTKGLVVDGEHVVVGSLNWNNHSARRNREVAVVLHGEEAASYYARVFDADWRASGGGSRLPVGLAAAVAVGVAGAVWVARREIRFAPTGR